MLYPDSVLADITSRFTDAHWAILQELGCELQTYESENGQNEYYALLPEHRLPTLLVSELESRLNMAPQYFRVHLAYVRGASAVDSVHDGADSRKKPVQISQNGYKMLQLRILQLQGGN